MMKIDWAFQLNEDGSSQGWNDPSIAEFKSNRLENLTREIIQNSIDAAIDAGTEVVVEFEETNIAADAFPNIESLREVVDLCDKQTAQQNSDMIKEFEAAKSTIKKPKIPVLSVSDHYTKGMRGPCVVGKPFYQYLKTVGQSGGDTNRAGSHGIGKAAPLACSDLRTIFVSTVWEEEDGQTRSLVQGRAVLMSFERDGGICKSTGYWGDAAKYQAVEPNEVPDAYKWMVRDTVGTTVHIMGWSSLIKENWDKLIIGFAISNFFAAFLRGRLSIKVKGQTVSQENVLSMAKNPIIHTAMKKNKTAEKLEDAQFYIQCLSDDDAVIKEETQVKYLGRTSLRMTIGENAPRKLALIRNNMLITDAIPGFWKKVPGKYRDFVGLVEVLNDEGSQFIRLMEPPSHNFLSVDWLPTSEDKRRGELALDELTGQLKKYVDRHAGSDDEEFGKVDFMAEFFADEAGDDRGEKITDEIDPNGKFIFSPKPIKLPPIRKITLESELDDELNDLAQSDSTSDLGQSDGDGEEEQDGGAGFQGGAGKITSNGGPNDGDATGGSGAAEEEKKKDIERDKPSHPIHLRSVRVVKKNDTKVQIFATPSGSASAMIRVHEVGSDFDDPFDIQSSDIGSIINGGVVVSLTQGERIQISVELSRPIVGGLKLVASHSELTKGASK
jgi:hypothetical protein